MLTGLHSDRAHFQLHTLLVLEGSTVPSARRALKILQGSLGFSETLASGIASGSNELPHPMCRIEASNLPEVAWQRTYVPHQT